MCILYTFLVLISKHKQIVIWLKEHNMEEIPGLKGVRPRALKFPDWHGSGNRTKKTEKGKQNTKTWKSEKRKLKIDWCLEINSCASISPECACTTTFLQSAPTTTFSPLLCTWYGDHGAARLKHNVNKSCFCFIFVVLFTCSGLLFKLRFHL